MSKEFILINLLWDWGGESDGYSSEAHGSLPKGTVLLGMSSIFQSLRSRRKTTLGLRSKDKEKIIKLSSKCV